MIDRRVVLASALYLGGLGLTPAVFASARLRPALFRRDPFLLGVASGYPHPHGMVLWTRLIADLLAPDGGVGPDDIEVGFEIALDPDFRQTVQAGLTLAEANFAHSVHLEVRGLEPGRGYYYRFSAGEHRSAVGRTWTCPAAGQPQLPLRIGVASCQHYEQGYYHAYRHMLETGVDLIAHLGDYLYEGNTAEPVRRHDRGECQSLADYRLRYAWYRSDPMLREAHAACPWALTHDDHEVDNDYAGEQSENASEQPGFMARRAAAYQAYYEHMPLPRDSLLAGGGLQLYRSQTVGDLLELHILDTRQYRSPQPCPTPPRRGGSRVFVDACPSWNDTSRSMLGETQERWLRQQLQNSRARWNLLAQSVVFSLVDEDPGPRQLHWNDSWAAYSAARLRLLEAVRDSGVANPVILGGDIHAFIAADQRFETNDGNSPIIASELVTTSISSGPPPQKVIDAYKSNTLNVHFADGSRRGYLWLQLSEQRLEARMIGFDSVRESPATARTLASLSIEAGRRGLQKL
jgi:alkaline phosphatase D